MEILLFFKWTEAKKKNCPMVKLKFKIQFWKPWTLRPLDLKGEGAFTLLSAIGS